MRADHQQLHARMLASQILERIDVSRSRHADIEQDDVHSRGSEQAKQLHRARRFANHRNAGVLADDAAQTFAHDRMIISYRDADHTWASASGTRNITFVP